MDGFETIADIARKKEDLTGDVRLPKTNSSFETVGDIQTNRTATVGDAFQKSRDTNPDEAAKTLDAANRTGLPPELAQHATDDLEFQDTVNKAAAMSPKAQDFLSKNAALAKDDLDSISALDHVWDYTKSLGKGVLEFGSGSLQGTYDVMELGQRRTAEGILAMLPDMGHGGKSDFLEGISKAIPSLETKDFKTAGKAIAALDKDIELRSESFGTDVTKGLGQLAGQIAISFLNPAVAVGAMFGSGAHEQAERADAAGADQGDKDIAVLAGGAVTAISEKIGLDLLMKRLTPKIRNRLLRFATDVAAGGSIEAAQEAIEGVLHNAIEMLMFNADKDLVEGVGREAAAAGGVGSIARAVVHLAVKGRIHGRKDDLDDERDAANVDVDKLKQSSEILSGSKLAGRSPDKAKELIEKLTESGKVYMDPMGADEYFQNIGEDADEWYQKMGVSDQVDMARAGEGMIEISVEDFLTADGIDAHIDGLGDDIRLTDNGLTKRQADIAEEFDAKKLNDVISNLKDEAALKDMGQTEAADEVYSDIVTQLSQSGTYDITAAREQATLWRSFVRTMAIRSGQDVKEFYEKIRPTIQSKINEDTRFRSNTAIEKMLARSRMNVEGYLPEDVGLSMTPVLDHLKGLGGVRRGTKLHAELDHMGITPKEFPRLFKSKADKKALGDVDNLEPRDVLENLANDGTYADREAILEAIRGEWVSKDPIRSQEEIDEISTMNAPLEYLADLMDHLDLSLDMDDGHIVNTINEAMAQDDGSFEQSAPSGVAAEQLAADRAKFVEQGVEALIGDNWNMVEVGSVPLVLSLANKMPRTPLKISPNKLRTIKKVHPEMFDDVNLENSSFFNILEGISDPVLVAKNDPKKQADGSVFVVTEYKDSDGSPIVVSVLPSGEVDFATVKTAFGKDNLNDVLMQKVRDGGQFLYGNENKALNSSHDPTAERVGWSKIQGSSPNMRSKQDLVNWRTAKPALYQDARGSFNPKTNIVSLFEKANLSTFLHESGHAYLEIMRELAADPASPQEIRDDYASILGWMGVDEMPADLAEATKHHEQFARGFEHYLMTGNAPSKELQSSFRKFKDWLVSIYKDFRGLSKDAGSKVSVSPEMVAVFDRMLATDEEIAAVKEEFDWRPSFRNAEEAGLTDAEYARWAQMYNEAEEAAREKMLARLLKDLTSQQKAWWKDEKGKVHDEVEGEINSSPVYNVINFLRRGETLNGATLGEPFKLNRADLKTYGPEIVRMLPGGKYGVHAKDGKSPDVVAAIFGFSSGETMVDQIIAASTVNEKGKVKFLTPAEAIDRRAQEIMEERHGHVLDPDRLRNEAIDAMHNVDSAVLLTMELNVLRNMKSQDIMDKASRRVAADGGSSIGDLDANTAPTESREAAFDAQATKARKEAISNQRRTEQAAVREARSINVPVAVLRDAAQKAVSEMSVSDLNRLSKYHAAEMRSSKAAELALAKRNIDAALAHKQSQVWNHLLYTEGLKAQKKSDGITRRLKKTAKRKTSASIDTEYLMKMRAVLTAHGFPAGLEPASAKQVVLDLADWVATENGTGAQIVIPEATYSTLDYKMMTFAQYQELDGAIKSLSKNGGDRSDRAKEEFRKEMEGLADSIMENNTERNPPPIEKGRMDWGGRVLKKVVSAHRKAEFMLRELDGFEDMGAMWTAIYKPLNDAANKSEAMREKAVDKMKDLFSTYRNDGYLNKKRHIKEIDESLSKEAIVAVALNMGNADNTNRIMEGYGWNDAQLDAVLSKMDDQDWDFVQSAWDMINGYWPEIAALEERMTGVAPAKVDAVPFVTPSGRELRGGYYPIKYDPRQTADAERDSADDIYKELISGGWGRAVTKHGHTKARAGGGGNRKILLSLEVIPQHIEQVIQDISFREAIGKVDKVVKSPAIQEAITSTKGLEHYQEFEPWVKDVATNDVSADPHWWAPLAKSLRSGLSVAEMGLSIRTALVQPFGITQTVARLGEGKALKAFGKYLFSGAHLSKATKDVIEKSVFMRNRAKLFDREVADQVRKLKRGALTDAKVMYFSLIAKTDEMVSVPAWMAGYDDAMSRWGDEAKAIDFADSIVRMTQSNGHVKDLARVQRGHEGHRLFTSFYSFFSVFHNMAIDAIKQTGDQKGAAKKALYMARQATWLVIVPTLANEIILNGLLGGEEDDEEKLKKAAIAMGTYAASGMVIARDIANYYGSDFGYSVSALGRTVETMAAAIPAIYTGVVDPDEFTRSDARSIVMALGYGAQLPTRQAWRTLDYLYQYSEGNVDDFSLHKALITGYKK